MARRTAQAPFFLPDRLIFAAIEDVSAATQALLDRLLATPVRQRTADERAWITQARRELAAYARVGTYWALGLRPVVLDSLWEIESLSEPGTKHHIWRQDGRWACDCKRAGSFHVHQAMLIIIERAQALADDEPEVEPPAPAQLGQRLAAARARSLEAV